MLEKEYLNQSIMELSEHHFLYKLDESLIWLFNTETGEYYSLNESSYFALQLFDGKRTVEEIRQMYISQYSLKVKSREVLIKDFNSLVEQWITANVIKLKT